MQVLNRIGMVGWLEKLKVEVEVNPRKKPYVTTEVAKEDERERVHQGRMVTTMLNSESIKSW